MALGSRLEEKWAVMPPSRDDDTAEGACCRDAERGHDHALCHQRRMEPEHSLLNTSKRWISWLVSVLCTTVLLNIITNSNLVQMCLSPKSRVGLGSGPAQGDAQHDVVHETARISSRQLSRRDACEVTIADGDDYNLPLRIGAVFIILTVSFGACVFPILAARFPGLKMPASFFFAVRHFGTGVLIATAFVHLLPTAFTLLSNPCLPSFWTEDYPAMPGAIALVGIFIVTLVEMILHPARRLPTDPTPKESGPMRARRLLKGRSASIGRSLSHIGRNEPEVPVVVEAPAPVEAIDLNRGETSSLDTLSPEQKLKKEIMHVILLEIGILFHSVFIGMALSVSIGGSEFVILLIAIVFHQTFEGLALGARISAIEWPNKSLQPIYMAIAYGCTTPIGQAIGLAARSAYSPDSQVGLILVGVMNAISSGLLVFASLVELLSEDLLTDESWRVLRGKKRVVACLLVFAGSVGMSLVGAWA